MMTENHLIPLFWQHGESETALRGEVARMDEAGIHAFIIEARPHPAYLKQGWWDDLAILLDEAGKRGMKAWIFDDGLYPSGSANNLIHELYPQYTKRYLAERHIDIAGPFPHASLWVGSFLSPEETLIAVVGGKRIDGQEALDADSLCILTDKVLDGVLWWDVPQGDWRIFMLIKTRDGGEPYTYKYLNPIVKEATACYINLVHEAHYERFPHEFGKTIAGFFTDEPRFGSHPSYDTLPGKPQAVLPWADDLLDELAGHMPSPEDALRLLPCLWYDALPASVDLRYLYMDVVSRRFADYFIGQMHDWCHAHGVRLIGHLVEENGAHARLGYGPGHFFRATKHLDMAGMDSVCNLYPGRREGMFLTHINYYDSAFNHWGLAKLTSSAALLDVRKQGLAACEAFGAYGWSEGVKAMKWITDALCVRGINVLIPHAFSPKAYPDPDCPPHFYAGGSNPQWKGFPTWSAYATRVCTLLAGGNPRLSVGVLYHAEAEWGGDFHPFEIIVKLLAQSQIDSLVIPGDDLGNGTVCEGRLHLAGQQLQAIIVPYAQYLPLAVADRLRALAAQGVPVYFEGDYPARCYGHSERFAPGGTRLIQTNALVAEMRRILTGEAVITPAGDALMLYRYEKDGREYCFCVNEDVHQSVDALVTLPYHAPVVLYDAMLDCSYSIPQERTAQVLQVRLKLDPYESVFLMPADGSVYPARPLPAQEDSIVPLEGSWSLALMPYDAQAFGQAQAIGELFNLTGPGKWPTFSGTACYTTTFTCDAQSSLLLDLGEVYELAEVWLNGHKLPTLICPPYRTTLPASLLRDGENDLKIHVTNTLAKANAGNLYDRYWPQEPSGLLGPVAVRRTPLRRDCIE